MTLYALTLSMIVTSLLLFSAKTEQSRIVTIKRPMVITQERKTPAYYAYQQTRRLQEHQTTQQKPEALSAPSAHLSRLSLSAQNGDVVRIAEMKLTRRELASLSHDTIPAIATARPLENEFSDPSLERVVAPYNGPLPEITSMMQSVVSPEPTLLAPSRKWATVKGKFELIDGVGIVDHYIELRRVEEGQSREVGQINLSTGSYSIDIESPGGYLIAQIKDRSTGGLVGEDRAQLINLQSRGNYYEGPFIRVGQPGTIAANMTYPGGTDTPRVASKASDSLASGKTSDFSSSAVTVSLFDGQNTLKKSTDSFSNIAASSSTILRMYDPGRVYKNLISIRHAGETTETSVFTSKWAEGVVEYVSDIQKIQYKNKNTPLLVGRVLVDGKPAANAQVQIVNQPGVFAVYLDQFMIPSFTQQQTSENGYFVFVGLEEGVYSVTATRQNQILGSQNFIAESDAIAFQNISSRSVARTKSARSFDAFTAEPIAADLISSESDSVIETTNGAAKFQSRAEFSVSEVVARTDDRRYVPLRYVYNSRQDYIHVPLISESWLQTVRNLRQINLMPGTGVLIGFVRDIDYDVYLISENYYPENRVYFDSRGQISTTPVKNGGFILFNVPIGAREVVLQEKGSERIHSQVFPVWEQQISAAHFLAD